MARLVDLSVALKNNTMDPNDVKITHLTHTASSRRMAKGVGVFAEVIGPNFCANDNVEALTHAGTHVDAPYHFGPMVEGKPAKKIDEVPVEWCYGNGVLLDFSSTKKSGEAITINDLEQQLKRINYTLKPMDIVLDPDRGRRGVRQESPFLGIRLRVGSRIGHVDSRPRGQGGWNRCLHLGYPHPFDGGRAEKRKPRGFLPRALCRKRQRVSPYRETL